MVNERLARMPPMPFFFALKMDIDGAPITPWR